MIAVGKRSKAGTDVPTIRYVKAAIRVAEVEALLARHKGKIAGLRRLGFRDEAAAEKPILVKIEELLRLCIENRDQVSNEPASDSIH